jgi:hypothetical protein
MLDLKDFTVAELSERANASESTVRTVLHRNPDLAEGGETDKRGHRGGVYVRHRLRPGAAERIQAELGEIVGQSATPTDLLAAEAMMLDELPNATEPAVRDYLRRRAEELLGGVLAEFESAPADHFHPDAAAHAVAVRVLLQLEDAEKLVETDHVGAVKAWRGLTKELHRARRELSAVDDGSLHAEIHSRIMESPLSDPSAANAAEDHSFADALARMARGCADRTLMQTSRPASSASAGLITMAADLERAASGLAALAAELGRDLVLVFPGRERSAPEFAGALASTSADVDGHHVSIAAMAGEEVRVNSRLREPLTRLIPAYSQRSSLMQHNARQMRHYVPLPRHARPAIDHDKVIPIDHDKAILTLVA